jgi:hypothetical protein
MNIPEGLKFEDNFESVGVSALSKVNLKGVKARYTEEITDQEIQVIFETEGNLDEAVSIVGDYRKYHAYEGTLGFVISTNRAKVRNHSDKLARVRYLMLPENEYLKSQYYQILETKEISATTDVDTELNADVTSMAFNVKFLLLE